MRWAAGLGLVVFAGLLAGCQQPYRVFAVQVASAAPSTASADPPLAVRQSARRRRSPQTGKSGARGRQAPWDLNRVPARLLRTLPGMDATTAQRILAGRPYHAKRDLLKRGILTPAQYAHWKASLVVHRSAAATSSR